jgi:hypothetical protein
MNPKLALWSAGDLVWPNGNIAFAEELWSPTGGRPDPAPGLPNGGTGPAHHFLRLVAGPSYVRGAPRIHIGFTGCSWACRQQLAILCGSGPAPRRRCAPNRRNSQRARSTASTLAAVDLRIRASARKVPERRRLAGKAVEGDNWLKKKSPPPDRKGRPRSNEVRVSRSIVADPNRPGPNAGVGTAALATPFATITTLSKAIVAMPSTPPALARTMVAVNLHEAGAHAIRHLAYSHWGCARYRSCCCQKGRRSQSVERSCHFFSHGRPRTTSGRPSEGPSVRA